MSLAPPSPNPPLQTLLQRRQPPCCFLNTAGTFPSSSALAAPCLGCFPCFMKSWFISYLLRETSLVPQLKFNSPAVIWYYAPCLFFLLYLRHFLKSYQTCSFSSSLTRKWAPLKQRFLPALLTTFSMPSTQQPLVSAVYCWVHTTAYMSLRYVWIQDHEDTKKIMSNSNWIWVENQEQLAQSLHEPNRRCEETRLLWSSNEQNTGKQQS